MAVGAFLGAILGAATVCVFQWVFYWFVTPGLLYGGGGLFLGVYFLFLLAPQGAWLGAVTGSAAAAVRDGGTRKAIRTALGGALLYLAVPLWFVVRDPLHFYPYEPSERWSQLGQYFCGGLVWSALLVTWALLRWTRPRAA